MPRKKQASGISVGDLADQLAPSPFPGFRPLMLCTLVKAAFDDPNWLFEPKLDGLRVLCHIDGKQAQIRSRNNKPQERQFPEIAQALPRQLKHRAVLDGEIVCLDEHGRSSFRALQQRFHLTDAAVVARRMKLYPAYLYLFDLLYIDQYDITPLPLAHRKLLLRQAVKWNDTIRWTDATIGQGIDLYEHACRHQEEGIIAKHLQSPYSGTRSKSWLKIKCSGRQEFVIGGYTDPKGSRSGFGALLVGYWSDDNRHLHYAGKVGTGFNDRLLRELHQQLQAIQRPTSPFTAGPKPPRGRDVHWVEPRLVAEIAYSEWTQHAQLRHPRFQGLRQDKPPTQIHREHPAPLPKTRRRSAKRA